MGNVMVQFSLLPIQTLQIFTQQLETVTILNEKNILIYRMSVDTSAITRWSLVQSQAHARWRFCTICVQSSRARI